MKKEIICPRCEKKWWTCKHVICFCPNCGAHLDCSDKGSYW